MGLQKAGARAFRPGLLPTVQPRRRRLPGMTENDQRWPCGARLRRWAAPMRTRAQTARKPPPVPPVLQPQVGGLSDPEAPLAVDLPVSDKVTVGFVGSLVPITRQLPEGRASSSVASGVYVTLSTVLPPGTRETGTVALQVTSSGVPAQRRIELTSSGALPVLRSVVVSVSRFFTVLCVKSTLGGSNVSAGASPTVAVPASASFTVGCAGSSLKNERQASLGNAPWAEGA